MQGCCAEPDRNKRPSLPTILLPNVQSWDDKIDKLHAQVKYQQDSKSCCMLTFTETRLEPSIPDCAVGPDSFSIYWHMGTKDSDKSGGRPNG